MNRERAVLACGAGAALLLAKQHPDDILSVAVFVAAFAGVRVLTDRRTPRVVLAAPLVPWAIQTIWEFFHRGSDGYLQASIPPFLWAIASLAMAAAFFTTILAAVPKIGFGLAMLSAGGLALSVGADSYTNMLRAFPTLNRDAVASATHVLELAGRIGHVGETLVPIAWLALALAPFEIPAFPSRKLAALGAIGAAICYALLGVMGGGERGPGFDAPAVVLYSMGWLLVILGIFGIARTNKSGLAWLGFALAIVQGVACPVMDGTLHANNASIVVAMAMAFGMLGLAFVAFSRAIPLRRFRIVAGALFASSALGSCFTDAGVFVSLEDIVRIDRDPSTWWTAKLAHFGAGWGLLVWCVTLALLAGPPPSVDRKIELGA
jgi:hypothetical protein